MKNTSTQNILSHSDRGEIREKIKTSVQAEGYVKITGSADKEVVSKAIHKTIRLYASLPFEGINADDDDPLQQNNEGFRLHIHEPDFSQSNNPETAALSWVQLRTTPFRNNDPSTFNSYLVKISSTEYWFYCRPGPGVGDTFFKEVNRIYNILQQYLANPLLKHESVDLLLLQERNFLKRFAESKTIVPYNKTILTLFQENVQRCPDAVAVIYEEEHLTFLQLNERSDQLANHLVQSGIKAEDLVPVCLPRSADMLVAILGILKAGGAYVPLDAAYPNERLDYILKDTRAKIIITYDHLIRHARNSPELKFIDLNVAADLLNNISNMQPMVQVQPTQLAYVIYTSGSTGQPKGVMIEHDALLDHCMGIIEHAGLHDCQSFALFAPLVFDAGHSIIHAALILGSVTHVISTALLSNGKELTDYINEHQIDCIKIVPSLWASFSEMSQVILARKVMIFGGEAFHPSIVQHLKNISYEGRVFNHYGPTEATIGKCIYKVDVTKEYSVVPIGKPFSNSRLYILDEVGREVPVGVTGELCIAGRGLARGYLNLPALTAKKFVTKDLPPYPPKRIYQTGDLVKWLPCGNLVYVGRKDEQVKIRGHRIEPGEIEKAIMDSGMIKQVVVMASSSILEAYLIINKTFELEKLQHHLSKNLPTYMLPAKWKLIEQIPLTINGKTDKKLLSLSGIEISKNQPFEVPTTPGQKALEVIWRTLLQSGPIGISDNFFDLGGHSLLAMGMVSSIRSALSVELSVADIFNYSTIKLLDQLIQTKTVKAGLSTVETLPRPAQIPLSFNQNRLYFIHQAKGTLPYHLPSLFRIKGEVNVQALSQAFMQVIERHESLRTTIADVNGSGHQVIQPASKWQLSVDEESYDDTKLMDAKIKLLVEQPFDLSGDFMLRATLMPAGLNEYLLIIVVHHIAFDGWSGPILFKELTSFYNSLSTSQKPVSNPLHFQYADHALWQQRSLVNNSWKKDLSFWQNNLSGVTILQLPTDKKRPTVQQYDGAIVKTVIDLNTYKQLQTLSRQQHATLFMTLLSALNMLLYRYTNQADICIGTPVAGRPYQQVEDLIGFFVNTIVLRNQVNGNNSFVDLLQQVKTNCLQAFDHQDVPFEKVVESVLQHRDPAYNPLFQVMLVLQNDSAKTKPGFNNLEVMPVKVKDTWLTTAKFDLTFIFTELDNGLELCLEYSTALFTESTMLKMMDHYTRLLSVLVQLPGEPTGKLQMLGAEDVHQQLHQYNEPSFPGQDNTTILSLFKQQVHGHPHNIAAVFESQQITFLELDKRSDQLADNINSMGIHQKMIPLLLNRNIEMLVTIMGILKAGCAYVPIDPDYPLERINFILRDAQARLVVCSNETCAILERTDKIELINIDSIKLNGIHCTCEKYEVKVSPNDVAYVIYTSGSTGRPKGTIIQHKALAASTLTRKRYYGNTGAVLLIPSIAFDSSVAVIFGSLIGGGKLILCRNQDVKQSEVLGNLLSNTETLLCVPSFYRFLLEENLVQHSTLSTVILAGEALDDKLVQSHFEVTKNCRLYNEYGPTEAAVWATVSQVMPMEKITIGKPINSVKIYIVNPQLQLAPTGVTGEICISGSQLAKGYLNLPNLTEEKFIDDPFSNIPGQKMYKTGDVARWLPGGTIDYLGRIDDQVKIRGNRVEPSGIEKVLQQCEAINQCAVLAKKDKRGENSLVAYVVPNGRFNIPQCVNFLKETLPLYAIPQYWVELPSMPLTSNGKINKSALPEPEFKAYDQADFILPETSLQKSLVSIWQSVLAVEDIGIHSDFFSIGGHSLLAMRLVSAMRKKLHVDISINNLFMYPTIFQLEELITGLAAEKNVSTNKKFLVPLKTGGTMVPLYIVAGGGSTSLRFREFSHLLHADQPVFVLQPPMDTDLLTEFPVTIEGIAARFIEEIIDQNPVGPYAISGHCLGGFIAFEIARQLKEMGKTVHALFLFDTVLKEKPAIDLYKKARYNFVHAQAKTLRKIFDKILFEWYLVTKHPREFISYKANLLNHFKRRSNAQKAHTPGKQEYNLDVLTRSAGICFNAAQQYQLPHFDGDVTIFYARERFLFYDENKNIRYKKLQLSDTTKLRWKQYCNNITVIDVNGDHSGMFEKSYAQELAHKVQEQLLKVNHLVCKLLPLAMYLIA